MVSSQSPLPLNSAVVSMYQLRLHRITNSWFGITPAFHHDSRVLIKEGSSLGPGFPSRVFPKMLIDSLTNSCCHSWRDNGRHREVRARFSTSGSPSQSGGFLGDGLGREGKIEDSHTRTRAYRKEDWEKLFRPQVVKEEELKDHFNEDPIWLWVFKSWLSGIKAMMRFLWEQPGQLKQIEWPSVKSTVKMALLTLVVVMFLMVFLSSVDSLFRHFLKSSMRPMT